MSKHSVTVARKNFLFNSRNLGAGQRLKVDGDQTALAGFYKYLINSIMTHNKDRNT